MEYEMTRPAIIINELDAERIDRLLEQPAFANSPVADALNDELDRAQMLALKPCRMMLSA